MKTLMTALPSVLSSPPRLSCRPQTLSGLVTAPSLHGAAIQECMAMNKKDLHDPYGSTGGVEHHYAACMATKGQPQ